MDKYRIGIIGMGTMGRNLLLNIASHGFSGAGYDKDATKIQLLEQEGAGMQVKGFADISAFIDSLEKPAVIILLVPAGKIVDDVVAELQPLLAKGDIIIDGGNSHFTDTTKRVEKLEAVGLHFFGMGVSGGEEGARYGPSMMPGGDKEAYLHVQPVLEAIAAQVEGEPCVTYIGPGASGHFVKMVHNGIEYAIMQLIADTYEIMRVAQSWSEEKIHETFAEWNSGDLKSYLLEITSDIFAYKDADGKLLVDKIKDEAKSKGTGKWTTQISTDLELPIPTIDLAVAMRDLSKYKTLREELSDIFPRQKNEKPVFKESAFRDLLKQAYTFGLVSIYSQGIHLLSRASEVYNYQLRLNEIARIWRGGCIIRSSFLELIRKGFERDPTLTHLFLDPDVGSILKFTEQSVRTLVAECIASGVSAPAYASAISYFDAIRSAEMPSNLIQAQRDYFGAHTYELIGKSGVFHTEWTHPAANVPV